MSTDRKYGVCYTADGGHPEGTGAVIIGWLQRNGSDAVFAVLGDALEACEMDGWAGYVVVYPTGEPIKR